TRDSRLERVADYLVNRMDIFSVDGSLQSFIDKLIPFRRIRLDPNHNVSVVATSTRFSDELAFSSAGVADRFQIDDVGCVRLDVDRVFASQTLTDVLQLQFGHSPDNDLSVHVFVIYAESGILVTK